MEKLTLLKAAIASVVAVGFGIGAQQALAATNTDNTGMEKCYGVSAKGKNDCGTAQHACAGQSTSERDAGEWIYVPQGACGKIAGGSTTPPPAIPTATQPPEPNIPQL